MSWLANNHNADQSNNTQEPPASAEVLRLIRISKFFFFSFISRNQADFLSHWGKWVKVRIFVVNQNLSQICALKLRYYSDELKSAQILLRKSELKFAHWGLCQTHRSRSFAIPVFSPHVFWHPFPKYTSNPFSQSLSMN